MFKLDPPATFSDKVSGGGKLFFVVFILKEEEAALNIIFCLSTYLFILLTGKAKL